MIIKTIHVFKALNIAVVCLCLFFSIGANANTSELTKTMLAEDEALFSAFNQCLDPTQLQKYSDYHSPDIEFYHDNGGVTWDRESMMANVKKNVCGKFTRQLVDNSFKAFPINKFGAITKGVHMFCQKDTDSCAGKAEFVIVWQFKDEQWKITRVLSYGHEAND